MALRAGNTISIQSVRFFEMIIRGWHFGPRILSIVSTTTTTIDGSAIRRQILNQHPLELRGTQPLRIRRKRRNPRKEPRHTQTRVLEVEDDQVGLPLLRGHGWKVVLSRGAPRRNKAPTQRGRTSPCRKGRNAVQNYSRMENEILLAPDRWCRVRPKV